MKPDIHPKYREIQVTCSCGNSFVTNSALAGKDGLRLEICANCHPFYTGKRKLIDTGGMVERFNKKYAKFSHKEQQEEPPKEEHTEQKDKELQKEPHKEQQKEPLKKEHTGQKSKELQKEPRKEKKSKEQKEGTGK
jgi:large subunit ribosomal protein L31